MEAKREKTYDEYLAEEPVYPGEPKTIREVYAVRRMIQDRTDGMTPAEEIAYYHEHGAIK